MRIAVLSDVHANLHALQAVMADIKTHVPDETWFLGDLVGYGAHPARCIDIIRENCDLALGGNHDEAALSGKPTNNKNAYGLSLELARRQCSGEQLGWLTSLMPRAVRHGILCVHGSPLKPMTEHINRTIAQARLELITEQGFSLCLYGHTHDAHVYRQRIDRPGWNKAPVKSITPPTEPGQSVRLDGYRALVNPGSAGRPQMNRDPRVMWMMLDTEAQRVVWHQVDYPIEYEVAAMTREGIPGGDSLYGGGLTTRHLPPSGVRSDGIYWY